MKRFYFNLEGKANVSDPKGLLLDNELSAFNFAQTLATELTNLRPTLRGNTTVVVTDGNKSQRFPIGMSNESRNAKEASPRSQQICTER